MVFDIWLISAFIGAVIIFALAFYAGKLLMQVKQQQVAQQAAEQQHQAKLAEHDTKIYNSIIIIVRAMKEAQCEYGEGAWRLSVLLDSLKLESQMSAKFPAIVELYENIKHHAILDDRKQLPKKERMKQDVERMSAEARLTPQISIELDSLYDVAVAQKSALSE